MASSHNLLLLWTSREELIYQVLLVNGVVSLGSSDAEVARFPHEVRKAQHIAELIIETRTPEIHDRPSLVAVSNLA